LPGCRGRLRARRSAVLRGYGSGYPAPLSSTNHTLLDMNLGFIGLGIMGAPMAAHLADAGHALFVHTRSRAPAGLAAKATVLPNARAVAERADIVFTMLPDTPDVEAVLFGETGVAAGLSEGKVVVDMSSISPTATKAFARRIDELGCEYLDAPV